MAGGVQRAGHVRARKCLGLVAVVVAVVVIATPAQATRSAVDHHRTRHGTKHHRRHDRPPRSGPAPIVELPVTFSVQNVNRSMMPCQADGNRYMVRGYLVAPATLLKAPHPSVTLYLHGSALTEQLTWRQRAEPGYDYATEEARLGQASVVIDRLGYGTSDIPNGNQVCIGSWADTTHQIVQQLRGGGYTAANARGPAFGRVFLAAVSFGGLIAPVEAYSFGDVDGLIVISSAFDQALSSLSVLQSSVLGPGLQAVPACAGGGEPKRPGAPSGYAGFFNNAPSSEFFFNTDPAIVRAIHAGSERDPCGQSSIVATILVDRLYLSTIKVPVLLVFGAEDQVFPPPSGENQRNLYTGSRDVKLVTIPQCGHFPMLCRTAPTFRSQVATWLTTHRG